MTAPATKASLAAMKYLHAAPPRRSAFISVAKGLSIIAIVLYHYLPKTQVEGFLSKAYLFGGAGIYIFLFASGYGLYHSGFTTWGGYYRKRFSRVLLPYYLGITMIFLLNSWHSVYPDSWPEYLSHLFLFKMFYEPSTSSFGNHFWFVSTIIQFYILWPVILGWVQKQPSLQVLLLSFLLSVVYSILITVTGADASKIWLRFLPQYFWVLVLGAVVAKENWLPWLLQISSFIYLGILLVSFGIVLGMALFAGHGGMLFNDYFMFLGFFSCCMLCHFLAREVRALRKFLLWIESFSYALYIWHMMVLLLYMSFRQQARLPLEEVAIVFILAVATALLFEFVVGKLTNIRLQKPSAERIFQSKELT